MGVFSKTCEYAIRAVFYISQRTHEGYKTGIKEIASNIDSPEPFLAKILQKLAKAGIVQSVKGPNGGFYIDIASFDRPLSDIVEAIDGAEIFTGCAMGLSFCSEVNPCPLHNDFKEVRNRITEMLHRTSISQFDEELIRGQLSLNK
ncbi:MAG: RrF2 family transcriptional regulator [Sphingobacterium sp.]|uniref:RrF2 family transcriptional regulator n=1 Tax=Sphingobacterium sp. JB170 TaxID=1434842 RepID=UPI00097EAF74|nr:Rrf2 family transcriptional regulator [Sphingobacterium sp. JB170]SJN45146.1 Rrf2 family transcriptional regulator [Sphingobacterium sp. JB170]